MKHYFHFAFLSIKRHSFSNALNLFGLSSAMAAFILIMLFVWEEYHNDDFNKNFDNIYRLEVKSSDEPKTSVFLMGATGKTLVNDFPEITAATIFMPWGKLEEESFIWITGNQEHKSFEDYSYTDEFLTEIFTFDYVEGVSYKPLDEPNSAMVSKSFAKKAWGNESAIGKTLKMQEWNFTVKSVFNDLPQNSVIRCPIILKLPENSRLGIYAKEWDMTNYPQFILVEPGTDMDLLSEKINNHSIIKEAYNHFVNKNATASLVTKPLKKLRFSSDVAENPLFATTNKTFVDALALVGMLVMIVAIINYINFTTATISKRLKNIGIQRVLGSKRAEISLIYLIETSAIFVAAFLLSILVSFTLNSILVKPLLGIAIDISENVPLMFIFGSGCVVLGIVAGIYPTYKFSSQSMYTDLKGKSHSGKTTLKGIMSVGQFAATIALIVASIAIMKQVRFMENANTGFNKERTMVIHLNRDLRNNIKSFENKLLQNPLIKEFAYSRAVPGHAQELHKPQVEGQYCPIWYWAVDADYIEMMGFEIKDGRNFFKDSEADEGNLICNEAAIHKYGWKLGTQVRGKEIVGVLADFNFTSLRQEVEPFAFWYTNSKDFMTSLSIKIASDDVAATINSVLAAYHELNPETPLRYFFLDEHLEHLYAGENQQVSLVMAFGMLSIIISVLGIFGLSKFMCQQKVKEIGVRKVNGAKVWEVMSMLNKDFIKWVAIGFFIASPIAWYAMNKWLESFAYITELSWWVFVLSGMLALGIALITVSIQSFKAASRNPVEALRYE